MLRRFQLLDPGGPLLPVLYIDDQTGIIYSNGIPQITTTQFPLTAINTGGGGGGGPVTELFPVPSSPTPTFDFTVNGNGIRQTTILTSDITPVFTGSNAGDEVTVIFVQDGSGGHSVTWPSNVSDQTPQPTSLANSSSVFEWIFDGTDYLLINAIGGQ